MKLLLTLKKWNINNEDVLKIMQVELLQSSIVALSSTNEHEGTFLFETDDESLINRILNDYEHCTPVFTDNNLTGINVSEAGDDPDSRKIPDGNWKVRVRPALLRAATTTHFFNN